MELQRVRYDWTDFTSLLHFPTWKLCLTPVGNSKSAFALFVKVCFLSVLSIVLWLDSVQFSHWSVQLFATPWTTAHQASLSITNSQNLLKLMSIESVMPANHLILCHPLCSYPHSFPASGSSPMNRLLASGSQSTGASASGSVFPANIHGWFPLGLTALISLLFKGLSRVFSNTTIWKHQFSTTQPSLWSNSHIHTWLLEKP